MANHDLQAIDRHKGAASTAGSVPTLHSHRFELCGAPLSDKEWCERDRNLCPPRCPPNCAAFRVSLPFLVGEKCALSTGAMRTGTAPKSTRTCNEWPWRDGAAG